MDLSFFGGTYFYTGGEQRHSADYNSGCCSLKRATTETGGMTWCAPARSYSFSYENFDLKTLYVKGVMNNSQIAKTCAEEDMVPVCDEGQVFFERGGGCQPFSPVSGGVSSWKFSTPDHDIIKTIDPEALAGTFFYSGNDAYVQRTLPMMLNMGDQT